MQQHQYETIVKCINFGSPATANELITALNGIVQLANERSAQIEAGKAANAARPAEEAKDNKKK